jgi:methyl-accepting chemotaxis protein
MKLTKKMIVGFSSVLVIFSIILLLVVQVRVTNMVNSSYAESIKTNAKLGYSLLDSKYKGEWERRGDKLYKGENLMNGDHSVVDAIKEDTGYYAAIFMNDVAVAAAPFSENGERMTGMGSPPEIAQSVLKEGTDYIGTVMLGGKKIDAYSMPLIKKAGNEIVGMWFVGIEKSRVNGEIMKTTLSIGLIILVMLVSGIFFSYVFGRKIIGRINELTGFASVISEGDLTGRDIEVDSKDEMRILADSFNHMKNNVLSIVKRIDEIGFNVQISSKELNESIQQNFLVCNEISTAMQDVAKDSELLAGEIGSISKKIEETYHELSRISEKPDGMKTEVFESIVRLKENVLNIAQSSKNIYYVTERFATAGEEILVSTEEQVASYEEIVKTSDKLFNNAGEMSMMVKKFKVVQ